MSAVNPLELVARLCPQKPMGNISDLTPHRGSTTPWEIAGKQGDSYLLIKTQRGHLTDDPTCKAQAKILVVLNIAEKVCTPAVWSALDDVWVWHGLACLVDAMWDQHPRSAFKENLGCILQQVKLPESGPIHMLFVACGRADESTWAQEVLAKLHVDTKRLHVTGVDSDDAAVREAKRNGRIHTAVPDTADRWLGLSQKHFHLAVVRHPESGRHNDSGPYWRRVADTLTHRADVTMLSFMASEECKKVFPEIVDIDAAKQDALGVWRLKCNDRCAFPMPDGNLSREIGSDRYTVYQIDKNSILG